MIYPELLTRTGLLAMATAPPVEGLKLKGAYITRQSASAFGADTVFDVRRGEPDALASIYASPGDRLTIGFGELSAFQDDLDVSINPLDTVALYSASIPPGGGGMRPTIILVLDDEIPVELSDNLQAINDLTPGADVIIKGNGSTWVSIGANVADGWAKLDGSGLIPSALLPGFVDDILEYANFAALPVSGETGKMYVTLDTNKTYRWSGSAYVEISASPGTTDALTEGVTNLYFTTARVLATVLTGLSLATGTAITSADTILAALGKLQKQITDLKASADLITEGTTNKYFTEARVLASILAGLSLATGTAITSADSVLSAFGKLQKQITDITMGGGGAASAQVDVITVAMSPYTWTKPTGAKRVEVVLIGGGAGGGSGRKGANGAGRAGGAGGAGGSMSVFSFNAADLGATETVTVGAGGAGGASQTTNSTNGIVGAKGGLTSFGNWLKAEGGNFGGQATSSNAAGGAITNGFPSTFYNSTAGASSSSTSGATAVVATLFAPTGGGCGGAINSAGSVLNNSANNGGDIGTTTGVNASSGLNSIISGGTGALSTTANGGAGNNSSVHYAGSGGGGGGASSSGNAGNGGAGGLYGGGGAGGGAAIDSVGNSGAGGAGGNGVAIVVTYF